MPGVWLLRAVRPVFCFSIVYEKNYREFIKVYFLAT